MDSPNPALLVTTGTRGDAAPFIAYASRLIQQGQEAILFSNADHESLARAFDVPFRSIAPADPPQGSVDGDAFFAHNLMSGYRAFQDYVADLVNSGGRPAIVARTGNWGAQYTAERFTLPFRRIALQPCAIRTDGHPISFHDFKILNAWRREIGLRAHEFTGRVEERWQDTISFFPKWFGDPESELPECGQCDGFQFLDDPMFSPDSELRRFLAAPKAPIVFTLGSGMSSVQNFLHAATEISCRLQQPIIFLSPFLEAGYADKEKHVLIRKSLDHHFVFQQAAMIVHNGGIGTTAQAIRSGVKQVVVPLMYDQPDNARRVWKAGMGAIVEAVPNLADLVCHYFSDWNCGLVGLRA